MTAKDILATTTMSPETREFLTELIDELYLSYGNYGNYDSANELYGTISLKIAELKRKCEKYDILKDSIKSIIED